MTATAESIYAGEWLKWMIERGFCLENRVIEAVAAPGLATVSGDVMRLKTGAKLQTVSAATGGDAVAILVEPVSLADSLADANRLCIVRGPAIIDSDKLTFTTSATQKAAALTALAALGIIAVNSALCTWDTQTT